MNLVLVLTITVLSLILDTYSSPSTSTVDWCGNSVNVSYENYTTMEKKNCCGKDSLCLQKCCRSGFYHHHDENFFESIFESACIKYDYPNSTSFKVPIYEGTKKKYDLEGGFSVGMLECKNKEWQYFKMNNSDPKEKFFVQANGSLFYPHWNKFYNTDRFCIDEGEGLTVYLCYTEDVGKWLARFVNSTGMIISMPFLLATFLVYLIIPESNLHRKALMSYVLSLLLAYIFLVTVQLYPGQFGDFFCATLGYLIIFFFLLSFFWMNVMCLDMWFAFSGMKGYGERRLAEKKRFILYSCYAVGVPLLHTVIVILINQFGDDGASYYPGVGAQKCFLNDNLPNLLYFYGPMAVLIAVNVALFIMTAVKIQKVKRETSMLKQSDSKRHSYEDDKQKFNLYVKLLFAMGINWTMEVISWAMQWKMGKDIPAYVWYLTDFCNALYGVFIFFIFVFKKKIWKALKKRYYTFRGKPHFAHSMSVTQTTRTSNYSTTDTGLSDHRLSELKNGRAEERSLTQN